MMAITRTPDRTIRRSAIRLARRRCIASPRSASGERTDPTGSISVPVSSMAPNRSPVGVRTVLGFTAVSLCIDDLVSRTIQRAGPVYPPRERVLPNLTNLVPLSTPCDPRAESSGAAFASRWDIPFSSERTVNAVQPNTAFVRGDVRRSWQEQSLLTLGQAEFQTACAGLMRGVEHDYDPTLVVGIRTGGLVVADSMARAASAPLPVLPVTCRRATTGAKSRIPLFRAALATLPRPAVDLLRRFEHRLSATARAHQKRPQLIDHDEINVIAEWLARRAAQQRVLVADDAVDSGVTLGTVLRHLRAVCPSGTEIRTAAITQTLDRPVTRPDYALFHGTLCRFPWSFDAVG
jgi:hypoxanthine phosphoribosyltransferase